MRGFIVTGIFIILIDISFGQIDVDVNKKSKDDKRVGVNVPGVYFMDLLTGRKGTGLGIDVLKGLVRVNVNRRRDPLTGKRYGPVSVEVGGHKIYDGSHSRYERPGRHHNQDYDRNETPHYRGRGPASGYESRREETSEADLYDHYDKRTKNYFPQ